MIGRFTKQLYKNHRSYSISPLIYVMNETYYTGIKYIVFNFIKAIKK